MAWPALAVAVSPASAVTGDVLSYLLGYGPVGLGLVALCWLLYRGWGLYSPSRLKAEKDACRADLEAQVSRLIAERDKAQQQRDEALRAAGDQLAPLMIAFTGATNSLIPLLQELVRTREVRGGRGGR